MYGVHMHSERANASFATSVGVQPFVVYVIGSSLINQHGQARTRIRKSPVDAELQTSSSAHEPPDVVADHLTQTKGTEQSGIRIDVGIWDQLGLSGRAGPLGPLGGN